MRRSSESTRFLIAHFSADLLLDELSMPIPIVRALPIWLWERADEGRWRNSGGL